MFCGDTYRSLDKVRYELLPRDSAEYGASGRPIPPPITRPLTFAHHWRIRAWAVF